MFLRPCLKHICLFRTIICALGDFKIGKVKTFQSFYRPERSESFFRTRLFCFWVSSIRSHSVYMSKLWRIKSRKWRVKFRVWRIKRFVPRDVHKFEFSLNFCNFFLFSSRYVFFFHLRALGLFLSIISVKFCKHIQPNSERIDIVCVFLLGASFPHKARGFVLVPAREREVDRFCSTFFFCFMNHKNATPLSFNEFLKDGLCQTKTVGRRLLKNHYL